MVIFPCLKSLLSQIILEFKKFKINMEIFHVIAILRVGKSINKVSEHKIIQNIYFLMLINTYNWGSISLAEEVVNIFHNCEPKPRILNSFAC